jgi:hypothetical protein
VDVVFAMKAAGGGPAGAEVPVALVETIVEEAIAAAFERGRLALNTICLDVVAERDLDRWLRSTFKSKQQTQGDMPWVCCYRARLNSLCFVAGGRASFVMRNSNSGRVVSGVTVIGLSRWMTFCSLS